MSETQQHTPGAIRAAEEINTQLAAANVRIAQVRLAEIIDRETAAPELLEALQTALRVLVTPASFPDKGKGRTNEQQAAYDAARAAIAKAEGK